MGQSKYHQDLAKLENKIEYNILINYLLRTYQHVLLEANLS
jgi:hypothetical protein